MESGMNNALSKHENYQEEKDKWGDESEFISEICMASEEKKHIIASEHIKINYELVEKKYT